jgi:VanZ family protein
MRGPYEATVTLGRKLWLFGPAILWCAVLFALSAQSRLPETPGGDKVAHVLAYIATGGLFVRAVLGGSSLGLPKAWLVAVLLGALYGLSDEFHQSFVPGRDASLGDAAADAFGSLVGASLGLVVYRNRREQLRGH